MMAQARRARDCVKPLKSIGKVSNSVPIEANGGRRRSRTPTCLALPGVQNQFASNGGAFQADVLPTSFLQIDQGFVDGISM